MKKLLYSYVIFVSIWFLGNQFFQDTWWGIVVLDKFAEYFLLAAVPVFVLSALARQLPTLLIAVIPVLVCGYFYLPFFTKLPATATTSRAEHFRVATYNIWNHNKSITTVAEIIRSSDSDVIAIQEVTEAQRTDLIDAVSQHYAYYYVSKPIYGGTTALFSRYPLENVLELDFQIDRPAIVADLVWNGHRTTVVSAHLNPSFWSYHEQPWQKIPGNFHQYIKDQNKQASMIIDELNNRADSVAAFLACDCNSQETASTNKLLASYFKDTLRAVGLQLGSPSDSSFAYERNLGHIDYVWFNGLASPIAIYRAKETAGSDHNPVIADFIFK